MYWYGETPDPGYRVSSVTRTVKIDKVPGNMIGVKNQKLIAFLSDRFGITQQVVVHSDHAYVTFVHEGAAQKALSTTSLWPNNKRMYVEQATDKLVAITLCPDDGTTSSYFEKLPLDCLFEIYRYLSPLDVANASEAMSFLSDFAKENIYKKYADGQMFRAGENWYWDDFHCVVRNFGEYFKRITLHSWNCYADDDYGEYNNNIFFVALVLRHCPNLEELRVLGFAWNKYTFRVLGKEHCAARKLFIRCWTFEFKLHELLAQWPKVKDLSIDLDNRIVDNLIVNQMVYVERFEVINAEVSSSNVCSFGNNNLTHLTLINVRNLTDYFYKGVKNWRSLERLQISVNSPTDVFNLAGSNVKYLQLMGEFEPQSAWILPPMGFLQFLEELDLFRIDGRNVRVAACVPTLRVLNIHNSNIGKDDEFAETINKLPKLRRLRLRKSSVCPDDLVELIEINGSLTEIVLELPPKETVDLLIQSLNRSIQTSTNERCFQELLVVVAEIDINLVDSTRHQLPYIRWIRQKDYKTDLRFDDQSDIVAPI